MRNYFAWGYLPKPMAWKLQGVRQFRPGDLPQIKSLPEPGIQIHHLLRQITIQCGKEPALTTLFKIITGEDNPFFIPVSPVIIKCAHNCVFEQWRQQKPSQQPFGILDKILLPILWAAVWNIPSIANNKKVE